MKLKRKARGRKKWKTTIDRNYKGDIDENGKNENKRRKDQGDSKDKKGTHFLNEILF